MSTKVSSDICTSDHMKCISIHNYVTITIGLCFVLGLKFMVPLSIVNFTHKRKNGILIKLICI
jgi:hypothetical protein